MKPLFSIIIPTFNKAHAIIETIESILNQSFQDWEIIIVDDGSTDETQTIIKAFLNKDCIQYFYQLNQGVAAARNSGAEKANGEYLVFLDADDWVENSWLETFNDLLKGAKDIAFCGARFHYKNGSEKGKLPKRLGYLYDDMIGIFNAGTYCVRKNLFSEVGGFDNRISFGENYELGVRVASRKPNYSFTDKLLLHYNKVGKRDDQTLAKRVASKNIMLLKYEQEFQLETIKLKKFKFNTYQSLAVDYFHLRQPVRGRETLMKAIKLQPLSFQSYIRYVLSLFNFYKRSNL